MDATMAKQEARQRIQSGRLESARELLETLCAHSPDDAEAQALLGVVLTMAQRYEDAVVRFRNALTLQPAAVSVHNNLGNVLKTLGDAAGAEACYRAALQLNPDYVHACSNLGALLAGMQRMDEAETWLTKATRLAPTFVDAWNHLGNLHLAKSDHPAAATCYRKALELNPGHVDSLCNLADLMAFDRRADAAEALYRDGLAVAPDHPDLRGGLARLLERRGRLDEARALIHAGGAADAGNIRILLARSALADRADDPSGVVGTLEAALASPLSDRQRMDVCFELGRLCDQSGRYEQAFHYYSAGNALDGTAFDEQAVAGEFDRLTRVFAHDDFRRWPRSGVGSELPVFIVGMPRSGTSLVEQILASHPAVFGAGELGAIDRIAADLPAHLGSREPYPECLRDLGRPAPIRALAEEHLADLQGMAPGALRVTDKMPHNFRHLGLIELLYPKARIIHCRRDPRDTCLSIYFNQFNANHPYASDLARLARYYAHYAALMAHWSNLLSLPLMTLDYEALVEDQEGTSRAMIEFLGLDWDAACLRFHTNRRDVDTPSYRQVRKPISDRSVGRWKHYAAFVGDAFGSIAPDG